MPDQFNRMKRNNQDAIDRGDLVGVDPSVMLALGQIELVPLRAVP